MIELRKLKDLKDVLVDPNWTGSKYKGFKHRITKQFINGTMVLYFGDGETHSFHRHTTSMGMRRMYTHTGPSGYSYHEDWFKDEIHLDEELFEL